MQEIAVLQYMVNSQLSGANYPANVIVSAMSEQGSKALAFVLIMLISIAIHSLKPHFPAILY